MKSRIFAEKKTDSPKKKATPKNITFPKNMNKASKKPAPKKKYAPKKKNTATKRLHLRKIWLPDIVIHQLIRREQKIKYFQSPNIFIILKEVFLSSDEISIDQT